MNVLAELFDRIGGVREAAERALVHYECRRYGTTLSRNDTACWYCGSDEIADIPP